MAHTIIYGLSIATDVRHEMATANASTSVIAKIAPTSLSRDSGHDAFGNPADKGAKRA